MGHGLHRSHPSSLAGAHQRPLCPVFRGALRRRPARARGGAPARPHAAEDRRKGEGGQGGEPAHAGAARARGALGRRRPALVVVCCCCARGDERGRARRRHGRVRVRQRGRGGGCDPAWRAGPARAEHCGGWVAPQRRGRGQGGGRGRDGGGPQGRARARRDAPREEEGARARAAHESHGHRAARKGPRQVCPSLSHELRLPIGMCADSRGRVLFSRAHRATGRDISEKIALGLAKPTLSKDSMLDARLFNREQYSASFGSSDSYNLYDKPLFSGSSAAAAIYKPRGRDVDEEGYEVNAEEVDKAMRNDRFGLGVAGKGRGFEGTDTSEIREGCASLSSSSGWRGSLITRPPVSCTGPSRSSATRPTPSASTPSSSRQRRARARARRSAGSTRATTSGGSASATTKCGASACAGCRVCSGGLRVCVFASIPPRLCVQLGSFCVSLPSCE